MVISYPPLQVSSQVQHVFVLVLYNCLHIPIHSQMDSRVVNKTLGDCTKIYFYGWVFRFVALMDGHIWIESEGLGKGCTATFIVKLGIPEKLNESKFPALPKVPANHIQANFSGLKVLVMDDNGSVTFPFIFCMHT